MSTQIVTETNYGDALHRILGDTPANASWLKTIRETAFDYFEATGFPTVDEEDWKYTNVAAFLKKNAAARADLATLADDKEIESGLYAETIESRLVFVNGALDAGRSSGVALPEGAALLPIREAIEDQKLGPIVRSTLATVVSRHKDGFAALNTALSEFGAFLYLPADTKIKTPVGIAFISGGAGFNPGSFQRTLIVLERGASATVLESYSGPENAAYYSNAVTEVVLGDGAELVHLRVQRESDDSLHIASTGAKLGRFARWNTTAINLGASMFRHGVSVSLENEGAECWVDGLYVTADGQHSDTHSDIQHLVPNCTSHQMYKGILDGKSRAVFNGKVFVHPGARGTDALQSNRNLLLSNEARIDTKPQLEIYNEDVKCAHGATVGQLEEEELFYLISRGLNRDLAKNLLTYGFAEEVINKIEIESVKAQLDEAVLNRLHARLE